MPEYVYNRAGVDCVRCSVGKRKMGANGGKNSKLNYQERVAVIVYCVLSSEIQRRLRMGKSKRGRASSSLYTPSPTGLNIDYD